MHIPGTMVKKTYENGMELRKDVVLHRWFFFSPITLKLGLVEGNTKISILYDSADEAIKAEINNKIRWEEL